MRSFRKINFNLKLVFCAWLALSTSAIAADVKISELPDAASIAGSEELPLVQSATTVRATVSELGTVLQPIDADLTSWAGVTRAAGADTFITTPTMANLGSLLTNEAAGFITFGTTPSSANFSTLVTDEAFNLDDSDLGSWASVTRAANFDTFVATPSMANLGGVLSDEGAGWITFGTTPSSANLDTLITDDTGSGLAVFNNSPVLTTPEISAFELGAGATDTTIARSAAGEATIEGDVLKHTGRRTITLYAGAGTYPTGGAIASCTPGPNVDSGSNDVFYRNCAFSASADNAMYWTITPPKSINESVDLVAQVDWLSTTTTDATDDVIFTMACVAFSNDDAVNGNAFPTVDTVTDTQTAAGDFLRSGEITAITPAGSWAEGDGLVCRLTRDGDAAGDNFNGTADVFAVQLHFTDNASSDD